MANAEHYDLLMKQEAALGKWLAENPNRHLLFFHSLDEAVVEQIFAWNIWRKENPDITPDLSGANLRRAELMGANLSRANLRGACLRETNLQEAYLEEADLTDTDLSSARLQWTRLSGAKLTGARFEERLLQGNTVGGASFAKLDLHRTNFSNTYLFAADFYESDLSDADLSGATLTLATFRQANLTRANLSGAHLYGVDFTWANLSGANLSGADMRNCQLVETNLKSANISNCKVYGVSAWNVELDATNQSNLVVTRGDEPSITVDYLEVAQFIYLLLNNKKLRDVINTITTKAVLILGRFTPKRKAVLDAIREELRKENYLPILFDFEGPGSRDITETVTLLASMARFIIADITDAKSIPQELQAIVPHLPSVPVQPLLLSTEHEYGMFEHFKHYPWVLNTHLYTSDEELITTLRENVIIPAEAKVKELERMRDG